MKTKGNMLKPWNRLLGLLFYGIADLTIYIRPPAIDGIQEITYPS
jgi:hypothetical protein